MTPKVLSLTCLMMLLFASVASATTFVVPDDEELIKKSNAIVIGTVEGSYVQETDGIIETVYEIRVDESLKEFPMPRGTTPLLRIVTPGGVIGDRGLHVEAAAHFEQGQRVLLFLTRHKGQWTTTDLTLGKFRFVTSTTGEPLLVRDMEDVVGWDRRGQVHHERVRRRDGFLDFIHERMQGRAAKTDYQVEASAVTLAPQEPVVGRGIEVNAPFPGATYTAWVSNQPTRWPNIAAGVTFRKVASQNISGVSDGGVSVIQNGLAAWTNECGSVINLIYGGTTTTPSTGFDGINVVEFNDPQNRISGSWTGSGTIGVTFNSFSNTHTFDGYTWWSISDADVVFQNGFPGTHGAFATAMTHELGHGIGWRHSNQDRITQGACVPTAEECTSAAIMNSSVNTAYNYTLQPWDVNAAQSVYPGGTCGPVCAPPVITSQPQGATIQSGSSHTMTVGATGSTPFTFQWYIGASGNTSSPITGATGSSLTVRPTATTSYWVRVTNACGFANSSTATVTVTAPPPPPPAARKGLRTDFDGDGKSEIFWRNPSTGANMLWFVNGTSVTSTANLPATGTQWTPATLADFNGDRRSDILWRDSAGNNYMWLMNGTTASGVAVPTQAASWNFVSSGDFDGDGMFDLFWRNTSTGANMVWFMNGATVRSSSALPSTAVAWTPQLFGDFDGDGRWDVLWRNSAGENYMWLMNGTYAAGVAVVSNPSNWTATATGDYNGDGRWDIFWRDASTGSNKIWLMNGATRTEVAEPATASTFVVGLTGDFNGNRTDDIAWRRTDGSNAVWLFVNASPSSGSLPSLSTAWQMYGKK
jgi:hypothetical protein